MNGIEQLEIPGFLEGEVLPMGYFDEPDPYHSPQTCKINLGALGNYIAQMGKKSGWELTKDEIKMFETA